MEFNQFDLVKLLIENKIDINAKDVNNITALDIAERHNFNEIKDYLIKKGAKIKNKKNKKV